jgi:hypothetical protein
MKASEQKTLSYLKKHNKYQKKEWDLVSVKLKILHFVLPEFKIRTLISTKKSCGKLLFQ